MPVRRSEAYLAAYLVDFSSMLGPARGAFSHLGEAFFTRVPATPLPDPYVVGFSDEVARLFGMPPSVAAAPDFAALFSGNTTRDWPAGALPYASVYSGHQFGVWAGQLGDGRALNIGELTATDDCRYELQLKGTGRTPYSRNGDGRAVLRSSIREFLCSEAMHYLGISTTRALAVIGSDAPVVREQIETSAVVTRVAETFVRFGHFEHFFANERPDLLRALADHVIDRFYPECRETDDPYLAMLEAVTLRTANLIAQWQAIGFCHGVMNTDNMSIVGMTMDYGPFGFVDAFDVNHVCNHSDIQGRYAYQMQPDIAHWNCYCLARALLPLIAYRHGATDSDVRAERAVDDVQAVLAKFPEHFGLAIDRAMRAKLGLEFECDEDAALAKQLLEIMHASRADFTLTFRNLSRVSKRDASGDMSVRDLFIDREAFDRWASLYRARLSKEARDDALRALAMNRTNPKYVLRNHLAEVAIQRAKQKDYSEVERLACVLRRPFDEQSEYEAYSAPPPDWAGSIEVSCSS